MVKMVNAIVAIIALVAMLHRTEADVYVVGDGLGWTIPPGGAGFYVEWASEHVPIVSDVDEIVFSFQEGDQDVAEVKTKEAYDTCTTTDVYWQSDESPVTLGNSPGNYYYVSTLPGHCAAGQKIALRWSNPSSSGLAAAQCPSPSPSASVEAKTSAKLSRKFIAKGV